jgi:cellulose synthase operon protein B
MFKTDERMSFMRKAFIAFVLVLVVVPLFFGGIEGVHALNANRLKFSPQAQEIDGILTFSELGYTERILLGPYDSTRILFSLPPTWQLQEGGTITLRYNFSSVGIEQSMFGGALIVYFNNIVLDTIYLDQAGQITKEISIPLSALQTITEEEGRHSILFFLDADINCIDPDFVSSLVISAESEVNFAYTVAPPAIDLSNFPAPIYQQSSLLKTPVTIVVPDQPSALELQSAIAVSTGLGTLTFGELDTELVSVGNLSDDARLSTNLIFVGLPANFTILQNINLPMPISSGGATLTGADDEDGIVQMSLSPWNPNGVVMFVSGNTEPGLVKAAAVIGSGAIFTSGRPDLAIVADVNVDTPAGSVPEVRSFAELGYENYTLGDIGGNYAAYSFYASPEQAVSSGAYIDLITTHSNLLDYDQSGVSVILNDEVIGSLDFDSEAEEASTTRIALLPNILRRGNNLLEVVTGLRPRDICFDRDLQSNWVTISDSSTVYMPSGGRELNLNGNINLDSFPSFLLTGRNLDDLAFVLPKDDQTSWNQASRIAYFLGAADESILIPNITAVYGDDVPESVLQERNLVVVGRSTGLPVIDQMKDSLPAPFETGSDEAIQPAMMVNYRLLPDVSVGYLQLATSPWNPDHVVLAVMGNADDGIPMAGLSLIKEELALQLQGNFAIIYGDQILTTDTRLGPARESLVGGLPVAVTVTPSQAEETSPEQQIVQPEIQGRTGWILPVLIAISIILIGLAIFALRSEKTKKKTEEKIVSEKEEE